MAKGNFNFYNIYMLCIIGPNYRTFVIWNPYDNNSSDSTMKVDNKHLSNEGKLKNNNWSSMIAV